jgi:predicted PurR-regulated permease PerM
MSNFNPKHKNNKNLALWLFVAFLSALLLSQLGGEYIANIFAGLFSASLPILLGILLAYLLKKLLFILETKVFNKLFLKSKKAKVYRRVLSLLLIFISLLAIIVFILMTVIPIIVNLATDLVNNSEQYISKVSNELTDFFAQFEFLNSLDLQTQITESINAFAADLESYLPAILDQAVQIASGTTLIILSIALSFILAFLILKDKEQIADFAKRVIYVNFKTYRADNIIRTTKKSDAILYSYFLGKVMEAAIIFVLVGIGFLIIGLPYAFVLSSIIALLNFIPYIGAIIGIFPITILTIIFASVNTAVLAILYALAVIIIITAFVSPVIFGKQLSVSALVVILSIIIGGGIFGIMGMLFAPPVVAILAVLINENIKDKEELKLIIKSHGLTEENLTKDEVLIEATKLMLEKKTKKEKTISKNKLKLKK